MELVDVEKLIPSVCIDIRYATKDNFMKMAVYSSAKCYLRRECAEKLRCVQEDLKEMGLGLKIWDAYRPLNVQRILWDITTDKQYVADPNGKGSNHNRGAAVDLTLIKLDTKEELEMPTPFDEFSIRAHSNTTDGISEVAMKNRSLLNDCMSKHKFEQLPHEWWHFNFYNCSECELMDINFEDIKL